MPQVYLNGRFMAPEAAQISPMDRGFLFADGIYEVIPAYNGVLFRFEEHLARLERSLAEVDIHNPHSREHWQTLCDELLQHNGGGNLSVYLQITRGAADKRDHAFPSPAVTPTVFMMTSPIAVPAADSPDTAVGAKAITLDDIRWEDFDASKVDPDILKAVKAAALVEFNAPDYVTYLCNVFSDCPDVKEAIHKWGDEEVQHGQALARWAELADPDFSF